MDTDDFEAASAVFAVVPGRCLVAAGEWSVGMGELSADVAHVEPGAGGFEARRIDPGVAFSTRCVLFVDSEAGDWMKVRPLSGLLIVILILIAIVIVIGRKD